MVYNSKMNSREFKGDASPWAKWFATTVCRMMVEKRARYVMFDELSQFGEEFVVVPKFANGEIEALAFYAPKLSNGQLTSLLHPSFKCLVRDWQQFGRAYVHFHVTSNDAVPLKVVDHSGTIRAVNELCTIDRELMPTLTEFDLALGSALEAKSRREHQAAMELGEGVLLSAQEALGPASRAENWRY